MQSREELEKLSSAELHDRALKVARHRADVKFFWRLLQATTAAEAATGEIGEAETDINSLYGRLNDLRHSGEGEVAELLRPLYVEYLEKHG